MKKALFLVAMVATLFASCQQEIILQPAVEASGDFTASFAETRTELDGTDVVWCEDDLLTIFSKTAHNRKYQVKELSTDRRTATFGYVSYTGADNTKITSNYALYPYDAEATLAGGVITTTLQPTQLYNGDDGNLGYALMVANSTTNNFAFSNAGSLLRFKVSKIVPDDYTLTSIKLTSAESNIAGEVTVDLNSADAKAVVTTNGVKEITLTDINAEITTDVKEFYVAVPAMSFAAKELTATFVFAEGEKSFELPAFDLAPGKIKNIAYEINDAEDFTGSTPNDSPANNEIWYTNGSTTEKTDPTHPNAFGANILSNTYDVDRECWVIKFDGAVTKIGEDAFADCSNLTSITIPNSVTSVEVFSFYACNSLVEFEGKFASEDGKCLIVDNTLIAFAIGCDVTEYTIPNNVIEIVECVFGSCSSLTNVIIPNSVTKIGEAAFAGCDSLAGIIIPEGVSVIAAGTFANCHSLASVTIPNSVTTIEEDAFYDCPSLTSITIPDRVTSIGEGAFVGCESLADIIIPDGISVIAADTFSNCNSLASVTIPNSVTTIGESAFYYCPSLTSITIPDSVTEIGESAFEYCVSLTSATIPDGVTLISDNVFSCCFWLENITIPNNVSEIGAGAFYSCSSLTSITIPDGVTTIGEGAFMECYSLTSVTIPDSVTEIGEGAFAACQNLEAFRGKFSSSDNTCLIIDGMLISHAPAAGLTEYTIPDDVTSIGHSAFCYCYNLQSVTIPDSVTEIGQCAFASCTSLESVFCEATTPPSLDDNVFMNNATGLKIYVPYASVDAYKSAAYWSSYASFILGYDFENNKVVE
ncbi:MAG: leucine-rich repeat protein [Alistipes sp.]|nr:leucine-rich repeat protein [Alistipes sp.]